MTIAHPAPPDEPPDIPETDGSELCSSQPDVNGIPLGESQLYPTSADSSPHGGAAASGSGWDRPGEPAPAMEVRFATADSPPFQEERGHSKLLRPDGAGPVERIFTVFRSDMKDS